MIVSGANISLLPIGCRVRIVTCDPALPAGFECLGGIGTICEPDEYIDDSRITPHKDRLVGGMIFDYRYRQLLNCRWAAFFDGDAVEVLRGEA